jgi:hypothetical protein
MIIAALSRRPPHPGVLTINHSIRIARVILSVIGDLVQISDRTGHPKADSARREAIVACVGRDQGRWRRHKACAPTFVGKAARALKVSGHAQRDFRRVPKVSSRALTVTSFGHALKVSKAPNGFSTGRVRIFAPSLRETAGILIALRIPPSPRLAEGDRNFVR